MAVKNLYSLGLLRNGKVYQNKDAAIQGLTQEATNDGVAKLARYLDPVLGGEPIIRTLVGFYANADEMSDNGGGQSSYTILDIDGSASDITTIKQEINQINNIIGSGIDGTTLTDAINGINDKIGTGFTEEFTVADAIAELAEELTDALKISLDVAGEPTSGYLKTYILSQGVGSAKTEVGRIDIPKDMVVSGGSLVHGYWSGDTFTENPDGPDTAIKIEFANADTIYINTKDLVDFYTAGNAAIDIDNTHNTISLKLDRDGEAFLTISESGLKLDGVQTAIDTKVEEVADRERLYGSDGISIASNNVKAVAASFSAPSIKNPISVDKDGIKFAKVLDCGFFDNDIAAPKTAEEVNEIANPSDTDLFLDTEEAVEALIKGNNKTFKTIGIEDTTIDKTIELSASESIVIDGLTVSGGKDNGNGKILYTAPAVSVKGIVVNNGTTVYNIFEGSQNNGDLKSFEASNVIVDAPTLTHNVFNVYKPANDAVITIKDSKFNLTVDNSNIARIANYANSTGVTVTFENVEWTYENGLSFNDWRWAGLIIYQPYGTDSGFVRDLTAMRTWKFNFINCKYNGVKVDDNNFGNHNQVFYMYNIGNDGLVKNPVAEGLNISFK